jgi:putative hemolysin
VLGGNPKVSREELTNTDLRELILEHSSLSIDERNLINEVFAASEETLREVMVPRTEVEFIAGETTFAEARALVENLPFSRYPVTMGSTDDVAGFVHVRDIYRFAEQAPNTAVSSRVRSVSHLPGTLSVLTALTAMRKEQRHLAIVADEYGGTDGVVTLEDLVEELIGDIRDEYDHRSKTLPKSRMGELIVDGLLNLTDFAEVAGFELPDGPYETVAGFMIAKSGTLPRVGDTVEVANHRLTVVELDGRRISLVKVISTSEEVA